MKGLEWLQCFGRIRMLLDWKESSDDASQAHSAEMAQAHKVRTEIEVLNQEATTIQQLVRQRRGARR